jgi:DnaJ-class molecular chaperone
VSYIRKGNCPRCGKPIEWETHWESFGTPYCDDCNKRYEKAFKKGEEKIAKERERCRKCDGSGRISGYKCMTCEGSGTVPVRYCNADIMWRIRNDW